MRRCHPFRDQCRGPFVRALEFPFLFVLAPRRPPDFGGFEASKISLCPAWTLTGAGLERPSFNKGLARPSFSVGLNRPSFGLGVLGGTGTIGTTAGSIVETVSASCVSASICEEAFSATSLKVAIVWHADDTFFTVAIELETRAICACGRCSFLANAGKIVLWRALLVLLRDWLVRGDRGARKVSATNHWLLAALLQGSTPFANTTAPV